MRLTDVYPVADEYINLSTLDTFLQFRNFFFQHIVPLSSISLQPLNSRTGLHVLGTEICVIGPLVCIPSEL